MSLELDTLTSRFAQPGVVRWIGQRPGRRAPMSVTDRVSLGLPGLEGDHRTKPGKRAVTLIQWEHIPVIAALAGLEDLAPETLRRNLAVSDVNLLALRKRRFRIGGAILEGTGLCAPCARMEAALGPGGFNAMRGHGGITACVLDAGEISLGDAVEPL